jgi:hypothetical protein
MSALLLIEQDDNVMRRAYVLIGVLISLLVFALFSSTPPTVSPVHAQLGLPSITPSLTFFPTFTPITTNTPPPAFIPTALTPSLTPTACITPQDFKVGDTVVLIPGISVRAQPNPNSALLANFQDRREFTIVGGPSCFGGFNFWQIEGHGLNGWVAEGRGTQYWLRLVRRGGTPTVPCLTALKLVPGEPFEVIYNIRIREAPSIAALTRTVVQEESNVVILEGPTCADGYNWWRVRAVVLGVTYEGWMAEATRFGEVFVEVTPEDDGSVCAYPLNFKAGERVRIIYNDGKPKNLRNAPDLEAAILYELVEGVPMVIVGGPICADTYNWWQVQILSSTEVVGWVAEGGPEQWWIARNRLP